MKLLVCISNVPDTTTKVTFTNNNTQFNAAGVQFILNPSDEIALSKAIELTEGSEGTVTVIHVGEASAEPTIRKALAIGADDGVRVDAFPQDAHFVASQIAAYAKDKSFDLILAGRESIDYNNALVGGMLGELLNIPVVSGITKLDVNGNQVSVQREIEGGKELVNVNLPAVVTCSEGVAEAKIPNMRGIMSARSKPLNVIEAISTEKLTDIIEYTTPPQRGAVKILSADETEKLVELLHTEAKVF
ncbi:MAG TPA: electron transfer flavoprotein subunit beta/FixA family protein [Pedobacter sp.]|jgi:electron transfer flavoprotein beta subunit